MHPAQAPLFSGQPGQKFQSTRFLESGASVFINRRVNLGLSQGNREEGGEKKSKHRRVFFILQPTTGVAVFLRTNDHYASRPLRASEKNWRNWYSTALFLYTNRKSCIDKDETGNQKTVKRPNLM